MSVVLENIANDATEEPSDDWCEGFEAGCDYARTVDVRLECLREAVKATGLQGASAVAVAREFYKFVSGQTCDDCGGELAAGEETVQ